jgi:glutamyl-tRNA synthetase
MGIRPDQTSYSSDYFEEMYQYCIKMIKDNKAYADDTEQEQMREERMNGIASKNRDATVETNLAHFAEMKTGSEEGIRWCIRAKISVDDNNKAMRDPVIYRCNLTPHHRTGSTWKIYPTYDFCVPILDALEGVTHALRTIEYRDRNPQYEWMQKAMGLRQVHIWDFARMNFVRTLLSKRKLTKFVESGVVWGWDDPRFPTIRGIRRRGMTIGALREFILKQGPSRNVVNLDWTIFWATNKKFIDPVAPRHTALESASVVTCKINGGPETPYTELKPKHIKNSEIGNKRVVFASEILIDQEDAKTFKKDEEITLMGWGNAIVRSISHSLNPLSLSTVTSITMDLHLQGDFKTTEKKITWLASQGQKLVDVELVDFDFLITKDKLEEEDNVDDFLTPKTEFRTSGIADENVAELKKDDIIQFERKGYFRVDEPASEGKAAVLFAIPTGKGGK